MGRGTRPERMEDTKALYILAYDLWAQVCTGWAFSAPGQWLPRGGKAVCKPLGPCASRHSPIGLRPELGRQLSWHVLLPVRCPSMGPAASGTMQHVLEPDCVKVSCALVSARPRTGSQVEPMARNQGLAQRAATERCGMDGCGSMAQYHVFA